MVCAPKGQESLAEGLPWVNFLYLRHRPVGAAEENLQINLS
jgi:hypothetical protein